jgi:hypothetical protein
MGLIQQNHQQFYVGRKKYTGDGVATVFTITEVPGALNALLNTGVMVVNDKVTIFINGDKLAQTFFNAAVGGTQFWNYYFLYDTTNGWHVQFITAPADGVNISVHIEVDLVTNSATSGPNAGLVDTISKYHVVTLEDIINNFVIAYTGEDKVISKISRTDIQFHAMRALQELSYDTFKSSKSQEIEVPPSLLMPLPQDYVNYVKITRKGGNGLQYTLYPELKSSNPKAILQNAQGEYIFDMNDDGVEDTTMLIHPESSDTWSSFGVSSAGGDNVDIDDTGFFASYYGQRYGINPERAQGNGSFYIDEVAGLIHFSSNLSSRTITLHYISDGLGTDKEMVVPKLAEEAMYKSIMCAILSTRSNVQEYIVQRYKREKFAAVRTAKLRLSNIKIEELAQVLRGQSKFVKH